MKYARHLFFLFALFIFLPTHAHAMSLEITGYNEGATMPNEMVFNGFGCTGKNISPALRWSEIPDGTNALALTVYDPDAPTGSGWWHWVVFNISPSVEGVLAGQKPAGIESLTDYGRPGYGGACPPKGDKPHHYIFTIYALKAKLPLNARSMPAMVGFYINENKIGQAQASLIYAR